jgi:hypothetical protein
LAGVGNEVLTALLTYLARKGDEIRLLLPRRFQMPDQKVIAKTATPSTTPVVVGVIYELRNKIEAAPIGTDICSRGDVPWTPIAPISSPR